MSEITTYLQYDFFRYAIAGVILISICAAAIGTYIISRRLVAISGGVTHACFGGLGLGYFLGVSPVAMAAAVAVVLMRVLSGASRFPTDRSKWWLLLSPELREDDGWG